MLDDITYIRILVWLTNINAPHSEFKRYLKISENDIKYHKKNIRKYWDLLDSNGFDYKSTNPPDCITNNELILTEAPGQTLPKVANAVIKQETTCSSISESFSAPCNIKFTDFGELDSIDKIKIFVEFIEKGASINKFRGVLGISKERIKQHTANLTKYKEIIGQFDKLSITCSDENVNYEYFKDRPDSIDIEDKSSNLCSCVVIGTTLTHRMRTLKETCLNIAKCENGIFSDKVLSIDDFGNSLSDEDMSFFKELGFKVIIKPRRGMVKNQIDGIIEASGRWIYYSEDDVILSKLPSLQDLEFIDSYNHCNSRKCGIISMWIGGMGNSACAGSISADMKNPNMYVCLPTPNDVLFIMNENYRNHVYINFPSAFLRRKQFLSCFNYLINKNNKDQIEVAYTKAWFELCMHRKYFNAIYMNDPRLHSTNIDYNMFKDIIPNNLIYIKNIDTETIHGGHGF